nr:hypothetical protein Iba_chr11aCG15980 [Ipomoea batatas]
MDRPPLLPVTRSNIQSSSFDVRGSSGQSSTFSLPSPRHLHQQRASSGVRRSVPLIVASGEQGLAMASSLLVTKQRRRFPRSRHRSTPTERRHDFGPPFRPPLSFVDDSMRAGPAATTYVAPILHRRGITAVTAASSSGKGNTATVNLLWWRPSPLFCLKKLSLRGWRAVLLLPLGGSGAPWQP